MTVGQYRAFKRFHKRSVKLRSWWDEQDFYSPLIAILIFCLLAAWWKW